MGVAVIQRAAPSQLQRFLLFLAREQSSLQSFYNATYNALIDNRCFNNETDSTCLEISDPGRSSIEKLTEY